MFPSAEVSIKCAWRKSHSNAQLQEPSVKPKVITIKQTISQSKKYCQDTKRRKQKKGGFFQTRPPQLKIMLAAAVRIIFLVAFYGSDSSLFTSCLSLFK